MPCSVEYSDEYNSFIYISSSVLPHWYWSKQIGKTMSKISPCLTTTMHIVVLGMRMFYPSAACIKDIDIQSSGVSITRVSSVFSAVCSGAD